MYKISVPIRNSFLEKDSRENTSAKRTIFHAF